MNSARCIRWSLSAIALFLCIACVPPEEEAGIPCTTAYDCPSGMECGPDLYCVEIEEVTDTPTGGNDGTIPDTTTDDAATDDAATDDAVTDDALTDDAATDTAMPDTAMPDEQTPDIDTAPDTETTDTETTDTATPDIDTATGCALNNGGCQQNCDDTGGTVVCSCNEGFALNGDGLTCSCADYYAGDDTTCTFCEADAQCGADCTACEGATLHCKNNGDATSQCVECTETAHCTVAGEVCGPTNECTTCLLPVTLGSWAGGSDGWTHDDDWWIRASGYMHLDYLPGHSSSYTKDLSYGSDILLTGCATAMLSFSVSLSDDPDSYGSDKSEKLYVQCSGDGGANWVSMTPDPWPTSKQQQECGSLPGYCAGGSGNDWSFSKTGQNIAVPAACLTAQARFRFHATGSTTWSLRAPGWTVYPVTVNGQ